MIANASIVQLRGLPHYLTPQTLGRTDRQRPKSAGDLLEFSRSPLRWSLGADEEPPDSASFGEALRMALLAPGTYAGNYVGRPATYTAMTHTCPRCGSVGTGEVCKKDGARRANVAKLKPWTNAATFCADWTRNALEAGRRIVSAEVVTALGTALVRLKADSLLERVLSASDTLLDIAGTWTDPVTNEPIALRTTVHIAPDEGGVHDNALVAVGDTADASPAIWAMRAYHKGLHVKAALDLALYNAARQDMRSQYFWVQVERGNPAVYGRRQAQPSMLAAGAEQLAAILGAYARCQLSGVWPGFDGTPEQQNEGWTSYALEPWMGAQNGSLPMPFAVGACVNLGRN